MQNMIIELLVSADSAGRLYNVVLAPSRSKFVFSQPIQYFRHFHQIVNVASVDHYLCRDNVHWHLYGSLAVLSVGAVSDL